MILIDQKLADPRIEKYLINLIEESKEEFEYYFPDEDPDYDGGDDIFAYDNPEFASLHQYYDCHPVKTRIAKPAIVYWMFIPSQKQDLFKVGKAKNAKNLKLRIQECKRWSAESRIAGYLQGTDETERVLHEILKNEECHVKNELFAFNPFSYGLFNLSCDKVFMKVEWD